MSQFINVAKCYACSTPTHTKRDLFFSTSQLKSQDIPLSHIHQNKMNEFNLKASHLPEHHDL